MVLSPKGHSHLKGDLFYFYYLILSILLYFVHMFLFFCYFYFALDFLANLYYSGTCSILDVVKPKSFKIPSSRLYTTPWIWRFCPRSQAYWTAELLETLITCCFTFIYTRVCYFFYWFPIKESLNLHLNYLIWLSHDYKAPKSFCWNAALIPPHL